MTNELPAPLVPVEVDLRDFAFMPLEVSRLLRSRTWLKAKRQPEIGFYLVNLWAGAWHEVPAGSLPDDDDVLADLARCTATRWKKLRGEILAAWVRCADGRLYHPVVAEKARDAWAHKLAQRRRTQAARDARRQRSDVPAAISAATPVTASKGEGEGEGQGQGQGQGERKGQGEEEATAPALSQAPDAEQAVALWNQAAAREGWPEVMFLNGPRRIALMARLGECGGLDGWRAALEAAARAEFLKGRDGAVHRWFTFDWILQPEKFTRLMEGRYAERHHRDETDSGGLGATLAALGRAGAGR
jgi:uncharacterized protein YdaU (DUF1376 family)